MLPQLRGSIDILAGYRPRLALAVGEVKGSIGAMEEMHRRLDVKERHALALGQERFGWNARIVGRLLILPEDRSIRRLVDRYAATMATGYPHAVERCGRGYVSPTALCEGSGFCQNCGMRSASTRSRPIS